MTKFLTALAATALLAGCSAVPKAEQALGAQASIPNSSVPQTILKDVQLHPGRASQGLNLEARTRILAAFRNQAREITGVAAVNLDAAGLNVTTLGALQAKGMFNGSFLAAETPVVLMTQNATFADPSEPQTTATVKRYGRLIGIYDPVNGEVLALGMTQ